ncbi:ABC transporter substrate-binding protein [Rossellomorea yichunensis]|uniref:ABC transporter substrate-binding protein n=1 Tax=Rossellomorea yichunensis TaxID=3077331 RepID=UPI0028DDAD41|nr:sugar ABC transporter substrate-binding protein [Rossellomorea sp. YC4-1]MDT9025626.1 sugar ABC transporter substrate-binding protein [Rossellomorea sp. YC4-1]
MKYKLTAIYVLAALLMLTAGIYSIFTFTSFQETSRDKDGEKLDEQAQIQLTFWRNKGTELENQAYEELVADFNKEHPAIEVEMVPIPYGDYELKLRTEMAAGDPPDILTIDTPTLALYASAGGLLSLDDYMRQDGHIEDLATPTLKGITYEDEIYLSPIAESSVALFYNIHLFEKAGVPLPSKNPHDPLTWDEVLEAAKKISALATDITGIDPGQGFPDGESPSYFKMPILWQFGGDVLDPGNQTASGYLNSPASLRALQFYQDLYQKHRVAKVELPEEALETDRLGMTVLGSWMVESLSMMNPDFRLGEDFGITALPKGSEQAVPNGGWSLGISSETDYPDEAWEFIQYVTSFEGAKKYVEITGDVPARYSVAEAFPEFNEYPKNIFVEQAQKYSRNRPITPAYPVVSEAVKALFEDVGIGGKDVKTSAEEAVKKINEELNDLE